jgi:TPR repeat protein
LLARGKSAEQLGNVSGARRLYFGAATLGNAAAALALGRLYDPMFLKQNALGGLDPDPELARHWYQRAAALGDPEAGRFLEALSGR